MFQHKKNIRWIFTDNNEVYRCKRECLENTRFAYIIIIFPKTFEHRITNVRQRRLELTASPVNYCYLFTVLMFLLMHRWLQLLFNYRLLLQYADVHQPFERNRETDDLSVLAMAEYLEFDWKTSMISHDVHILSIGDLRKPKVDKARSVEDLRSFIQHGTDEQLKTNMQQDDATLLRFLYARNFNVPDAYLLMQNCYWYRQRNPSLFADLVPSAPDVRKAFENVLPGVLGARDRRGRTVLILYATNWDCSYGLASVYRALLVALELLIADVQNQANGLVVVVDWTEFSLRQTANLKPSMLKLMIEGLQDCFPARFKGVHFIGQPWYVDAALTVIKPFLKDKIKERIYVHGNNLSTLHDYLPKDILPTELGGDLATYNPEVWIKSIQPKMGT